MRVKCIRRPTAHATRAAVAHMHLCIRASAVRYRAGARACAKIRTTDNKQCFKDLAALVRCVDGPMTRACVRTREPRARLFCVCSALWPHANWDVAVVVGLARRHRTYNEPNTVCSHIGRLINWWPASITRNDGLAIIFVLY